MHRELKKSDKKGSKEAKLDEMFGHIDTPDPGGQI